MSDYLDHPRVDTPGVSHSEVQVPEPIIIGVDLASGPDETVRTLVERPKCVVQVWMEEDRKKPHWPYRLIETEFPDFASFLEFVEADRLIAGDWLFTRWSKDEHMVRVVHDRKAIAFRGGEVRRAQLPSFRLVEGDAP